MRRVDFVPQPTRLARVLALAIALLAGGIAFGQAPEPVYAPPVASPTYVSPPVEQSAPPAYAPPVGQLLAQPPRSGGSLRRFFAGSLSVVAQATGLTVITGVTEAVTGGISSWFSRNRTGQRAQTATAPAPAAGTPTYASAADPATAPTYAPVPGYAPAPAAGTAPVYAPGPASAPADGVMYYDAYTGSSVAPDPVFAEPASASVPLFAGLAYEIHAQAPGGGTMPVNPATHQFRTGDRFLVRYRPTLPGRIDVYNINPSGKQTHIDTVEVAAAQLAQLGPYEFSATRGEERLRLVLTPCSSAQMYSTTRDIIRVESPSAAGSFNLAACGPPTRLTGARAPATRDIRKVAIEDNTGFALDPVDPQELASGQLAPREVTITFWHR